MAALKSRRYACPDCDGEFDILKTDEDAPPSFCPLCGADVRADVEPIPFFSRVGNVKHGTLDNVYRRMESASIARAEEAASMLGTSVADQSNIKMTNMKDNLREGDTSFIAPQMSSTPVAAPPPSNITPINPTAGLATAQMIRQSGGSVGNRVMDGLRGQHASRSRSIQRNGEMAKF